MAEDDPPPRNDPAASGAPIDGHSAGLVEPSQDATVNESNGETAAAPSSIGSEAELLTGAVNPEAGASATARADAVESLGETSEKQPGRMVRVASKWGPYRRWVWQRSVRRDRSSEQLWRDSDGEENARGRLPNDERVDVAAVWVVELYTPSTVPGLLDGIAKLHWEHGRSRGDNLVKWMNDVRNGRQAGWTTLGLVSPQGNPHMMTERTAVLPQGVKAAIGSLMSITPSITALVMAFFLDDDAARALERPMRVDYTTFFKNDPLFRRRHLVAYVLRDRPTRFGQLIHTPDVQRRDAVRNHLSGLERDCTRWIAENVPGLFASGLHGGMFPTAMLLVTEKAKPLTEETRQVEALRGTGLDRDFDCWESTEWPGGRMTLPQSWDEQELRLTFGCRRRDAFPDRPGYAEPESNWTIAQRADDLVPGLLTRWALTCMLDGYHQLVSAQRDRSAASRTYRTVADLKDFRALVRTEAYDLLSSVDEVRRFAKSKRGYHYNVLEMQYARPVRGKQPDLVPSMRTNQRARARQIETEAALLLSTLSSSSNLTQVVSNLRIQRFLIFLTVVSIAAAVVAIVVAVHANA